MASTPLTMASFGKLGPLALSAFLLPAGLVLFAFVSIFLLAFACWLSWYSRHQRGGYRSVQATDDIYNNTYYDRDNFDTETTDIPLSRSRDWSSPVYSTVVDVADLT
ncbi:hypothetical protein MMC32_006191 [Xylographa parallela]|nr:hypothetical protein [Xylographa parallela]